MAFLTHHLPSTEWWLGIDSENLSWATYRQEHLCHLLTIGHGIGPHSSGGTFSSLLEWRGNHKAIERALESAGAAWFLPFFERGMETSDLSEEMVLEAFIHCHGFDPIPVRANEYPIEQFRRSPFRRACPLKQE